MPTVDHATWLTGKPPCSITFYDFISSRSSYQVAFLTGDQQCWQKRHGYSEVLMLFTTDGLWAVLMSTDQVSPKLKYDFYSHNTFYWKDQSHLPTFPSSCTDRSSLFKFQLGSRNVFFNSPAKEIFNISLGVNKCRHKQVASLCRIIYGTNMRSRTVSEAEILQKNLKLNQSHQCKVNQIHSWTLSKRSTDDQACQMSLCLWGFSWDIKFRPRSQIQERWWQDPSQRKVWLVQDLESITCKG